MMMICVRYSGVSRPGARSDFFQIEYFTLQFFRMTITSKSRNNANLHVLQDPPLVIGRSPLLTPVSSQLENKNFRSLIRPGKCVRSSLASQNSCTSAPIASSHLPTGLVSARQELTVFSVIKD